MSTAILIAVSVQPPNNVAVVPMTADNRGATLAAAQTQIGKCLSDLAVAMNDFVTVAGGSTFYNGGTNQLGGTPAATPAPTQAQVQALLNALNTALADFNQVSPMVAAAQQSTPGINGVTIEVDTTAVPDTPTLSGAFQQALQFVQSTGVLPV